MWSAYADDKHPTSSATLLLRRADAMDGIVLHLLPHWTRLICWGHEPQVVISSITFQRGVSLR